MELNLDKLKGLTQLIYLLFIVGILIPGYLIVFIYNNELFIRLDNFKLSVLSFAITTPIFVLNSFLSIIINRADFNSFKGFHLKNQFTILISTIISSFLNIVVIIKGIFSGADVMDAIVTICVLETIIILGFLLWFSVYYFKNKSDK